MSTYKEDIIKRFEKVIIAIKEDEDSVNFKKLKEQLEKIEEMVMNEKKRPRRLTTAEKRERMKDWKVLYSMNKDQLYSFFNDKDRFKDVEDVKQFLFGFLSSKVLLKVKTIDTIVEHVYSTTSKKPDLIFDR